jgi:hypothetical protein
MLFYLQQAIKKYSDVLFNNSESCEFFFSHFQYKNFLTNSATNTAVLYLFVALRTQGICEVSPSDAIHETVRFA